MSSSTGGRRRSEDLVARAREEMTAGSERPDATTTAADPDPVRDGEHVPPPAGTARFGPLALLVPAGIVAFVALRVVSGDALRARIDESACAWTGCTGTGMAAVGWLLITLPVLWAVVAVVLWARFSAPARVGAVLLGLAFLLVAWVHVPGRRSALDLLLDGPAAGAMATGIRWGGVGAGVAVVAVLVRTVRADGGRRPDRGPVGPALVAVALLGTLAVALVRAEAPPVTVAEAMPERTFEAAGDTLRRTGGKDLRGCAGVLAGDVLDGCVRTVRVTYTTDDSDAVVHLAAVLYPGERAARERRGRLPRGTAQLGIPAGETITVSSTTGSWVLLSSVGHADGRSIAGAERGYLLWAAKQVAYRFIGRQVGLLVAPSAGDGVGPRTP
ncbi:hypothetical protein RMN56_17735 [Micromonospora halotolerans]|uniref:Uncharacterized protein n=1 Tax=Micromonospora halotolerans TaxID=709879 RepID=A0ABY9ZP70_9ACTN|nr:hypothetical protein [Micromonospora halotolerans]WNM37033.1 hypothetical protein RMN56_17735 [Micromonospora halotolerans]